MIPLLTPNSLEAMYLYIRATSPKKWVFPDPDDLAFRVSRHGDRFGHFDDKNGERPFPEIAISEVHVKTSKSLLETMAHECIHLSLYTEHCPHWYTHGSRFKSRAKRLCAIHGFRLEDMI